jgi:hypothetical protein
MNKKSTKFGSKLDFKGGFMADAKRVAKRSVKGHWDDELQAKLHDKIGNPRDYII